jgi:hypothetical protein
MSLDVPISLACVIAGWVHVCIFGFHAKVENVPLNRAFEVPRQVVLSNYLIDFSGNKWYCCLLQATYDIIPFCVTLFRAIDRPVFLDTDLLLLGIDFPILTSCNAQ